jgi:PAS domain S-box-containing protein
MEALWPAGLEPPATNADGQPMNLGLLRPGRLVAAHVAAVLVALGVGLATDHVLAALAAASLLGVIAHVVGQAHQRLRSDALERRYRQLVEDMPLSFYITSIDSNMEPLYVSPAIVDLLGYSLDEWKTNPLLFEEIIHPLDSERVLRAITCAKEEMNPYEAEYRLYHKNGTVVWVQDRAVTVRDTRGGRFHWQGFLVDVTARKQAEARYRTLVEQLPLITYIDTPYSADEAAAYVSPQIEEILGYRLEEWHSNPSFFVDHLHPEDRERVRDAQREARLAAQPLEVEYRFIAADGRVVWLSDSYTVVRDETGKPWYTQGFAVDVTARKQAERDRETLLTQTQEQNERLRKLDRLKDEFIALVSHELRTPLTSICGYLELLLQDDVMAGLPEAQLSWLEVIDRNAERLMRLVEDLLLTAQASAGNLALEHGDLDITAIIDQAVQACRPVAAARSITLTYATETLPPASGDRLRIGQVIDNLVSNALKFTPAGGTVDVRAYPHDSAVRIEVADTGMGISEDEQAQLFERFFRTARAQEEAIPGVGLGLSISKAIVEGHNGRISVRSVEGAGTRFFVDLPAAATRIRVVPAA